VACSNTILQKIAPGVHNQYTFDNNVNVCLRLYYYFNIHFLETSLVLSHSVFIPLSGPSNGMPPPTAFCPQEAFSSLGEKLSIPKRSCSEMYTMQLNKTEDVSIL
jgi:hypothetical protein